MTLTDFAPHVCVSLLSVDGDNKTKHKQTDTHTNTHTHARAHTHTRERGEEQTKTKLKEKMTWGTSFDTGTSHWGVVVVTPECQSEGDGFEPISPVGFFSPDVLSRKAGDGVLQLR